MDLLDRLRELSLRIPNQLPHLQTEEATKTALVMPLISALGYNVFDPTEVVPEFTADVGVKKGEKVDYAIIREGEAVLLFECKASNVNLDDAHASQLYRYFSVTSARFGVLTNGVVYRFFSDLEAPNRMDSRPFMEFNLLRLDEKVTNELKRFAKEGFDVEAILSTASDLKYTKGIKRTLSEEWVNPSEELARLLGARVYSGRMTQQVREQFSQIVKRAFHEFVTDRVNERLKSALERTDAQAGNAQGDSPEEQTDLGVGERELRTTEEEREGFYIVRAIIADVVDVRRVFMRDTQSYCGILVDDNNRKPVCRLHFNSETRKYIGVFDEQKNETRHLVKDSTEIYTFADQLRATARRYDR